MASLGAAEHDSRQSAAEPKVMDGLSSSKVTVEYHDPSGVFSLIREDLAARLPLRNLHWKAPTRPLRSIDSLHVDLVPSKGSAQAAGDAPSSLAPGQGTSIKNTKVIFRASDKWKERRHQIPGLRQTPYLKLYLLRCDDSETYKSTARKQVREWVKDHTPPSQSSTSSTQENHDAYEWMIVHVVVPETPAASQPRGSNSTTGEKEKTGPASRWTRGTTTLLEKLRADFNVSSKTAPDRVAQIRVPKERVPPHMLPAPAPAATPAITESPQEQERAWADIIAKFKVLILLTFDLRVSQYEEDIRKNDAQRSFPGWNFNTFFILKEGLARGFESVGLVEDALLGYDELSIGLDSVIRDQSSEQAQGSVLLSYSDDLYQTAAELAHQQEGSTSNASQPSIHDDTPINALKKDYRGLILANNISVFDFRLYIFARQMFLLLRLGNSISARSDLAATLQSRPNASIIQRSTDDSGIGMKSAGQGNDSEDLFSLADLCSRALNFITFAGRLLRDDLINGAKAHDITFPEHLVENVVRSWTFAALEQVLRETSTGSLPFTRASRDLAAGSSGKSLSFGGRNKEQKAKASDPKSLIHPARSTSLNNGRPVSEMPYSQTAQGAQVVFENGQYHERAAVAQQSILPSTKNGLQELAGTRAQLLAIQRRLLEHVGRTMGWNIGWNAILASLNAKEELKEVDLEDEEERAAERGDPVPEPAIDASKPRLGISAGALTLSDLIVKHYMAAGQSKSAESVLGDLAALRFELGDFAAAAMYFGRMASYFAEARWNTVETTMLKMHARCLKKLNRKDEYVRTVLDLLAKSAASRMALKSASKQASAEDPSDVHRDWLNDDKVDTTDVFHEIISYSQQLPYDVTVQMAKYFGDISVEPYVRHYDDKDGFQLRLHFRHLLEDAIEIRAAKIRLVSAISNQSKDVWLEETGAIQLKKGVNRMWIGCNVNTIGPYMVDRIVLEAKRIVFVHEPLQKTEATTPLGIITSVSAHSLKAAKKARILCFPRSEAFQARIYLSHFIHIDKPRHIEVECSSGWNEITHAEVRLKSASAGLRLRTANASVVAGEVEVDDSKPTPGVVAIGAMPANTTVTLKVPYDMETILQDLNIKVDVDYYTEKGQFQYTSSSVIPVELPLDVNVHDHFKSKSLVSKFNIKTASQVPLELLDVALEGSEEFEVQAARRPKESLHVFPKQPVAVTYKITKTATDAANKRQSRISMTGSLSLTVEYRCLNEDVLDRVRKLFADAVEASPVHRLSRLLVETFANRIEHNVLPHQYEKIALLDKVELGAFEDMSWADCLESLPLIIRDDTQTWLQKWHEKHKTISLTKDNNTPDTDTAAVAVAPPSPHPPRRMVITVSIPQTHILHTASLTLDSPQNVSHTTIATVGQPLPATLRISHTRRWATPSSLLSAANMTSPSDPLDFYYTIDANPDVWLVAGQRRAHFSAQEDEVKAWNVVLIPLRAGNALMPNVEIRAKPKPKKEVEVEGKQKVVVEGDVLNCDTDYWSYGDAVVVVPDVGTSTVGVVGAMEQQGQKGGVVWLESQGLGTSLV
ncbi:tmem1 family [Pyrenophora seminiperda CCB06]|uniref:Tmem1 family n=1 Tax=Pyrenophora seminiperda CCB06 TaxID=1302712 RepID=A0A3M7ME79_9PLEO|nr:tmem1 family [Pyrenophora seminiperda CCB06]